MNILAVVGSLVLAFPPFVVLGDFLGVVGLLAGVVVGLVFGTALGPVDVVGVVGAEVVTFTEVLGEEVVATF